MDHRRPQWSRQNRFCVGVPAAKRGLPVLLNAYLIVAGLAPLAPERRIVAASRVFLREISQDILAKRDFGFESTLAGLAYRQLIQRLKSEGWRVELIYLALPSVEMAKHRA